MERKKARWLALIASSLVAAALFALGWSWLAGRKPETVRARIGEAPAATGVPRTQLPGKTLDPERPEQWAYSLTPEEAEKFYALSLDPRVAYDPWLSMRELPHQRVEIPWPEHPDGKFVFLTNDVGCREDRDLAGRRADLRVLVAGDSHTCGICNNAETFTQRLENALAARWPTKSVEALNAALGGYDPYNYLGTLHAFRDFAPQVFVCTLFGGNDFAECYRLSVLLDGAPGYQRAVRHEKRLEEALAISKDGVAQALAELDLLRNLEDQRGLVVDAVTRVCLEMKRVAEKQGTTPVFVYLPCPFELRWPDPDPDYVRARDVLALKDSDFSLVGEAADRTLANLRAAGARVVDLRPTFAAEPVPPYWRSDFHVDLRGHELVARELEPLVAELLTRE